MATQRRDHPWISHETMDRYGWRGDKALERRRTARPLGLELAMRRMLRRRFFSREKEGVYTLYTPGAPLWRQGQG